MIGKPIKSTDKAIKVYHGALETYAAHGVTHEGAVSTAFQSLLASTARKAAGWTLIPQEPLNVGGKSIRPDGVLQDEWSLRHGYWEAKDSHDNLDAEIRKKITGERK